MNLVIALSFATLFGAGVSLMLRRYSLLLIPGSMLVSNAVIVLVLAPIFSETKPPIHPTPAGPGGDLADPLPQAMALTAIVIGFGIAALLVAIVYRVTAEAGDKPAPLDVAELAEAEADQMADAEHVRKGPWC